MSETGPGTGPTPNDSNRPTTTWVVEYDVEPIRLRDPVGEALAVLDPGDPFVFTYVDVVKVAGHSCPIAAGAFRITLLGLDELYADEIPVRGDVEVIAAGPRDDSTDAVTGRLISFVTGAAGVEGFGGLHGGDGDRRNLLTHDGFDPGTPDPTFRLRRTDSVDTVEVTYHVGEVPAVGPAIENLRRIVDGDASGEERSAFIEAWHGRVRAVLADDDLFTVGPVEP